MEPDETAHDTFDPRRDRIRLVSVEARRPAGGAEPEVQVVLAAGDRTAAAARSGDPTGTAPLRPVVRATLEALDDLLATGPSFELLAVDRVVAAGMDVLLVALESPDLDGPSLVGAISVEDRDPAAVGALATLDAVNRVVGRDPEATD